MDGPGVFTLHWDEDGIKHESDVETTEEVICGLDNVQGQSYSNITSEEMIANTDQIAAENLMYLAQDVMGYTETVELAVDPNVECVTEEVITDDWVTPGGPERVDVPLDQLTNQLLIVKDENELDVPLPTDQDEYTAMRPWPCDFCSRRFRKKAALMNHMVAHQNDRPHSCNLCGVQYLRKCDLMNHLKTHAFVPDDPDTVDYDDILLQQRQLVVKPKKKRGRRKKSEPVENGVWENMTSARTQQWSRRSRPPKRPPSPPSPPSEPEPPASPAPPVSPAPPSPLPIPVDPTRPFVCKHCGVGFAREKALQSHSRVHGGDSPVECGSCGELCWSRESLAAHTRAKHPHQPPRPSKPSADYNDSNSGDDMDYRMSPQGDSGSEVSRGRGDVPGPEMFCLDCGVAFQRADLLRRHVAAAHSYKRHDSTSSAWGEPEREHEHTCDVCGETCADALQLLAHAEGHAERHRPTNTRLKKVNRGRNITSSSSTGSRQFPCKECGKVFGSRSSQQIHVRIHTGERPYGCRFCWKAFADGGTLRKHERIHTGEKPYACAVCPRAFNQRVVLREHVRSHHSAPDRSSRHNGGPAYTCIVCSRSLHSSAELVQHLIEHCDANTALKRQPQAGPRKYKRRRKLKSASVSPARSWSPPAEETPGPHLSPRPERPARAPRPPRAPRPARAPRPPRATRTPRTPAARRAPAPRPKMIHTEEKPKNKQREVPMRTRRPPRHPADDLRAIQLRSPPPESPPLESPAHSPEDTVSLRQQSGPDSPDQYSAEETSYAESPGGPYRCHICSMEFGHRDGLLLHVPVHI